MRAPSERAPASAGPAGWLLSKCLLALVFGMALTMSFAPARAWWFAPYCVAGWMVLLNGCWRSALVIGACFGVGWFGAGFWWILPALDSFSDAGMLFSWQLTVALVLYMSMFPAGAAVVLAHCRRTACPGLQGRLWTAIQMALVFAVAEWLRGTVFGGFPMLATGYAHTDGPLAGFAPVIGVNGLGFLNGLVAALLAGACWQPREARRWREGIETAAAIVLVAGAGVLLKQVDWAGDTGRSLSVSLLQGNISQSDKFSDAGLARAVATYVEMAAAGQGRLIVLPETALPAEWSVLPQGVAALFQRIADERDATIVVGSVVHRAAGATGSPRDELTNSAVVLQPRQPIADALRQRYDKQHLVPLAESLPYGTGWIGRRLGMNFNGLAPGRDGQPPLEAAGARIGITICFESLFDSAVAGKAGDAEMMLNLTNFAWFAGSYAPVQHLQVAQMRALETARWFVQVSNTGMTALIDAHGAVQHQLPPDEAGVLEGRVPLRSGQTPFMLLGNGPLLGAAGLAWIWTVRRRLPQLAVAVRRPWPRRR